MRPLIKTANRIDTVWTAFIMFPAVMLLLNVGIALHQGSATPAQLTSAANELAIKFTGQYLPYVETTSAMLLNGIEKLASVAKSCVSHSSGPVYLDPAMAGSNGCALGRISSNNTPALKPYGAYR